jgi:spore germination protein
LRTELPEASRRATDAARSYRGRWRGILRRGGHGCRERSGPAHRRAAPKGSEFRRLSLLRRTLSLKLAVVLLSALLVGLTVRTGARATLVVASVPYWNNAYGATAVLSNRHLFSEVSPWMYGLDSSGRIVTQYGPGQSAAADAKLARLRAAGIPLVPSLANVVQGNWAYRPVAVMLHNPTLRAQHVAAIVALVQQQHYAGIDIDYEDLHASDRNAFTAFVTQLAAALHAKGKVLSVDVFAKTTDRGYDQRNAAQDYAAIGQAADQVRLMGYDYHWASSSPGPVAPIGWIRDVLRYAKTQIPANKIILGIPLYGYDWAGGHGTPVSWLQAFRLAIKYHVPVQFDATSQEPWFGYTDQSGNSHVVWFENAPSSKAKLDAALGAGIGGVYLWMYGYEDSSIWAALRQTLPMGRASVVSTSPTGT